MPDSHRILVLAGRFAPRGSTVQALALVRGLAAEGHEIRIICPDARLVTPQQQSGLTFEERPALEWPVARPLAWEPAGGPPSPSVNAICAQRFRT